MIEMNIASAVTNLTTNFTNSLTSDLSNFTQLNTPLDTINPTDTPLNELIANVTGAAYELTTQWISYTLATVTEPPTEATTTTNYTASTNDSTAAVSGWLTNATLNDLVVGSGAGSFNADYYEDFSPCNPSNPNFNCTPDEYVEFCLGPQVLPLYKALLVTIIFGGIFLTGVLGNVLVCVVIVRHSTMHTATNYYLFSLAVSDLLYLLFGLPAEVIIYWHQYPYLFSLPFCKIRAFISEASTYVSVLTIVAFSMERFLAICYPLHLYAMSGFKRALRIIAILWIVSFISAIPFGWMTGLSYVHYPLDDTVILKSAFCSMVHYSEDVPIFELSFCVFFVIPMILIIALYGKMYAQIRSRTTQQLGVQQGSMHRESRHSQSRKAVIRMLAAVVITFFVCWLPFHMQRLWFLYAKENENFQEINEWMFSITGFAYYVSCTINPILYNVMSHRYRVAFKDILCGKRTTQYYSNGFARDQSSFRETTIASSLGGNSNYDRVHSVRIRSIRHMNNVKDRDSIKSNNALWTKKTDFNLPMQKNIPEDQATLGTNVVVVVDNGINGRPKVYTENEAQETLINKSNETCI